MTNSGIIPARSLHLGVRAPGGGRALLVQVQRQRRDALPTGGDRRASHATRIRAAGVTFFVGVHISTFLSTFRIWNAILYAIPNSFHMLHSTFHTTAECLRREQLAELGINSDHPAGVLLVRKA